MAGGPHEVDPRLREPIPLPRQFDEKEAVVGRLRSKVARAQALRALAEIGKMPQWSEIRNRTGAVIANLLDALPLTFGQERDQMIGEIKAWRQFASSPDDALEAVRRLDSEIGELEAALGPKVPS